MTNPNIQIRKAERKRSKLRLGVAGPSGAGKTYSSLLLAQGLGGSICLIDTERGSGDLYADLLDYDIITLEPPFAPKFYYDAIKAAEQAGYDIIIIDSLSHAWQDEGGLLDQADKKAGSTDRFRVWSELTPQHRQLVNAMLNSPAHVIGTMRSKQSYAMDYDQKSGKHNIRKVGLAPVQREGMEYEFTIFMDIDQSHYATTSKDRTGQFADEVFMIDSSIGKRIKDWLESGKVDPNEQKKEIIKHLKRLDLPIPEEPIEAGQFITSAVQALTGIELKKDNYDQAIEELKKWQDKEQAHAIIAEEQEDTDPISDTPTEEEEAVNFEEEERKEIAEANKAKQQGASKNPTIKTGKDAAEAVKKLGKNKEEQPEAPAGSDGSQEPSQDGREQSQGDATGSDGSQEDNNPEEGQEEATADAQEEQQEGKSEASEAFEEIVKNNEQEQQ